MQLRKDHDNKSVKYNFLYVYSIIEIVFSSIYADFDKHLIFIHGR